MTAEPRNTAEELDEARAAITGPDPSPNAFRRYGRALRMHAARLRAQAEELDAMADASFRHAVSMPQDQETRIRAILGDLS